MQDVSAQEILIIAMCADFVSATTAPTFGCIL